MISSLRSFDELCDAVHGAPGKGNVPLGDELQELQWQAISLHTAHDRDHNSSAAYKVPKRSRGICKLIAPHCSNPPLHNVFHR